MRLQGLAGAIPLALGRCLVLPVLGEGGLHGAILAQQLIAPLLGHVAGLAGLAELAGFLVFLGFDLSGFRSGRWVLAPGMIEAAAYRAGLALLQGLAQPYHALTAHRAAAIDQGADAVEMALGPVQLFSGGLPLGQQSVTTALILAEVPGQIRQGLSAAAEFLPAAGQFLQRQMTPGGSVVRLLGSLAGLIQM